MAIIIADCFFIAYAMPELPEVEVTRLSFAERIAGARILSVRLGKPLRWPLGIEPHVLVGRQVRAVRRRGKYLLVDLDEGVRLMSRVEGLAPQFFHLAATGYVSDQGRLAARFEGSYDLLLTPALTQLPPKLGYLSMREANISL